MYFTDPNGPHAWTMWIFILFSFSQFSLNDDFIADQEAFDDKNVSFP